MTVKLKRTQKVDGKTVKASLTKALEEGRGNGQADQARSGARSCRRAPPRSR